MLEQARAYCDVCGAEITALWVSGRSWRWLSVSDGNAEGSGGNSEGLVCRSIVCAACWKGIPTHDDDKVGWLHRQMLAAFIAVRVVALPAKGKKPRKS